MRWSTLSTFLLTVAATVVSAQQTVAAATNSSNVISQYGSVFKNTGGSILYDKVNVYLIFYGNWTSTELQQEQTILMNFIDNISPSPWFNLLKQYTNSNGKTVSGPLNLAAAVNDAGSHSLNLTNTIHKQIVLDAVSSGYLSPTNRLDSNGIYVIMSGPDVTDSEFCSANCGYNSYSDEFQYMFIGYPGICADTCVPSVNQVSSPNNAPAMDAAISIFSHELQDVLTDPRGNGWVINADGGVAIELGDFCSMEGTSQEQFGNTTQGQNGAYNIELNGSKYLVQTIFDLSTKQCSLG